MTRYTSLLGIAVIPLVVFVACHDETLDLGRSDRDATNSPDTAPGPGPAETGGELPLGFWIDGISCPEVKAYSGSAYNWPAWQIHLLGPCPDLGLGSGDVSAIVVGRADLPYPQACSVATRIDFGLPPDSDGGGTTFSADVTRGSCTLGSGPTTANAATPLAFDAVVARSDDPTRTHHLTYRAERGPIISDGVDGGDGGIVEPPPPPDSDAGVFPTGGRPVATDCPATARRPGDPHAGSAGCQADTDCDGGAGRCKFESFVDGGSANVCLYDECARDTECSTGVCGCGVGKTAQNLCLTHSNCRVDADCATGERCAYSAPPVIFACSNCPIPGDAVGGTNYNGQALGYFCTSPQDTCLASTRPDGGITSDCSYNLDKGHWEWVLGP